MADVIYGLLAGLGQEGILLSVTTLLIALFFLGLFLITQSTKSGLNVSSSLSWLTGIKGLSVSCS